MINIDIVLLFQAVNFLVLLFLLNILLYRPIRKVMADRAAEIASAREKTVSVDADVRERWPTMSGGCGKRKRGQRKSGGR